MQKIFKVLPLVLATSTAMAYEQDKTYQFTVLHSNDTHGHFGQMIKANMALPHKKHWWTELKKK